MLMMAVSNATIIVNTGSFGAGVKEQVRPVLLHVHCDAPFWILEGASIQDAYEIQSSTFISESNMHILSQVQGTLSLNDESEKDSAILDIRDTDYLTLSVIKLQVEFPGK